MPVPVAVVFVPAILYAAATADVPSWLDSVSRVGVVGILLLGGFALHRKWLVQGWVYRDLDERHGRLRQRFDQLVDAVVRQARGVERSAELIDEVLAIRTRGDDEGLR